MKKSKINVFITPHFHYDWGWSDSPSMMGAKSAKIIKEALKIMRKHSNFKYAIDSVMSVEYFRLHYPDMVEELKKRVRQNKVELIGGMVVAPDTLLPNGESLVRQILYGKQYYKKNFSIDSKIGYLLDSFGQTAQLPQILKKAGYKYFVFIRGARDRNLPAEFIWKAPDGSKILAHCMYNTYRWTPIPFTGSFIPPLFPFLPIPFTLNLIPQNFRVYRLLKTLFPPIKWMVKKLNSLNIGISTNIGDISSSLKYTIEKRLQNSTTNNVFILNGDDNLPPSTNILDVVDYFKKKSKKYNLKISLPSKFFNHVMRSKQKYGVIKNYEFAGYPDKFVGTFSTRIKLKQKIRQLEQLFYITEIFCTLSSLYNENYNYPIERITKAIWRVLCCDFHDGIPGCHVDSVYTTIMKMLKLSEMQLNRLYQNALIEFKNNLDTSELDENSIPLLVFNPISNSRTDVGQLKINQKTHLYAILDEKGNQIAYQKDKINPKLNQIIFNSSQIPSIGYKIYQVVKKAKSNDLEYRNTNLEGILRTQGNLIEIDNNRFKLIFENSKLISIIDKLNNFTINSSRFYINDLRISVDRGDSYLHGRYPKKFYTTYENKLDIIEKGPVRTVIRIRSKLKCKNKWFFKPINQIIQYIILYNFESSRIDFITKFKNNIKNIRIQACFPINFENPKFYSETPYGVIERDIEPKFGQSWVNSNKKFGYFDQIFPVINWLDASEPNSKGLCLINNGLPEYEIAKKKDYLYLTLMRSTGYVANVFPGAVPMILGLFYGCPKALELTEHEFRYALFFHKGLSNHENLAAAAMSHNLPIITKKLERKKGFLPNDFSFVNVEPNTFLVKSIKKSEVNKKEIIIRVIETSNKESQGTLTFFSPIKEAFLVNLLEQPIKKLEIKDKNSFSFTSNPQEILTFSVSP